MVNNTKFGRRLAKPGKSNAVIFGTPAPKAERIYNNKNIQISLHDYDCSLAYT